MNAAEECDLRLDFRGTVSDYSALNASTGVGVSMGIKAATGSKRVILTVQSDGVYAIVKGDTDWTKVYSLASAGTLATWTIEVNSAGKAQLFRNGTDTGASWVIQDNLSTPILQYFVQGASGGGATSRLEWLQQSCRVQ